MNILQFKISDYVPNRTDKYHLYAPLTFPSLVLPIIFHSIHPFILHLSLSNDDVRREHNRKYFNKFNVCFKIIYYSTNQA